LVFSGGLYAGVVRNRVFATILGYSRQKPQKTRFLWLYRGPATGFLRQYLVTVGKNRKKLAGWAKSKPGFFGCDA